MAQYTETDFPITVIFTAMWRAPAGRVTVVPAEPHHTPMTATSVQKINAIRSWLVIELDGILNTTNAKQLRALDDDLPAIVRGALLKAARGEREAPFSITEETAMAAIVRLSDPHHL